ncbi:hypothetical protein [Methylobacterium persicinum]|uniref:CopG family transcriptional regulator n=1 Tax=Methylobacterium persicinum TaxID=374426 RepID=A0ABU0HGC0_9HYPH|nr:hypothetical protein [Methylobacterium persicinum]MDQ0440878.1 hypothetical protein [Methylobacterium persicinum]GJE39655.1 hypothetical protein KHHGKMAE_3739 [Methylobacterium persicinum]
MDKIAASIAQIAAEALLKAGADARAGADLPAPVMDGLRAWIADQPEPRPSVSEAVRLGIGEWLSGKGYLPAAVPSRD